MADDTKKTDTGALGVVFTHPSPKRQDDVAITKLYNQPLTAISNPKEEAGGAGVFNVERSLSGSRVEEGMIVSDRRKDRPSFFQNVIAAFKERRTQIQESLAHNHITKEDGTSANAVSTQKKKASVPNVVPSALHARVQETKPSAPKPSVPTPAPISPVRTMPKVSTSAPVVPHATAVPEVKKEVSATTLPKVRTFKGDAALLNPTTTKAAAVHAPEQIPATVSEKKVSAQKAQIPPQPVRIAVPDMRTTMIAPEVHTALSADSFAFTADTKSATPIIKIETPQPTAVVPAHNAPIVDASAHWTYTKETVDAVLDAEQKTLEHIPLSEIKKSDLASAAEPHFVDEPAYEPQESEHERVLRINETLARMRAEKETQTAPDILRGESKEDGFGQEMPLIESREKLSAYVKPGAEQAASVPPVPEKLSEYAQNKPFHAVNTDAHDGSTVDSAPTITKPVHVPLPPKELSRRAPAARTHSSFGFALRIFAVLVIVAGIAGLSTYVFIRNDAAVPDTTYTSTDDRPTPVPQTDTPLPSSAHTAELMLGTDTHTFLTDIATRVTDAPAGLEEFMVYTDATFRTATAQELFAQLDTSLAPQAIRALEPVFVIGSITTDTNTPFIVIRSNNFDTLFAGMLAWEPSMQQELSPLFGEARTTDTVFEDAVRNNKSIRILRDTDGTEVLLYSFVDNRTVIITQSAEALAKLITQF